MLQEVVSALSLRRNILINAARQSGLSYSFLPPAPPLVSRHLLDSGLVILSRFPISHSGSMTYKHWCNVDQIMAKGALYAAVEVSQDLSVHVFTTHLQSSMAYQMLNMAHTRHNA